MLLPVLTTDLLGRLVAVLRWSWVLSLAVTAPTLFTALVVDALVIEFDPPMVRIGARPP